MHFKKAITIDLQSNTIDITKHRWPYKCTMSTQSRTSPSAPGSCTALWSRSAWPPARPPRRQSRRSGSARSATSATAWNSRRAAGCFGPAAPACTCDGAPPGTGGACARPGVWPAPARAGPPCTRSGRAFCSECWRRTPRSDAPTLWVWNWFFLSNQNSQYFLIYVFEIFVSRHSLHMY